MTHFRLLIVEDDADTRNQFQALFREALPGSDVRTASDVAEAHILLQQALETRRCFDVAVLDFKLPRSLGEHPDVDESICCRIRDTMPGTLVVHVTGFLDDSAVRDHIAAVHSPADPLGFILGKSDAEFATRLVIQTQQYLYGTCVTQHMIELFDTVSARKTGRRAASGDQARYVDISARLIDVSSDIAVSWRLLSNEIRQWVLNHFEVDDSGGSIRVTLR